MAGRSLCRRVGERYLKLHAARINLRRERARPSIRWPPGDRGEGVYTAVLEYRRAAPRAARPATAPAFRKCFAECARSDVIGNRSVW